MTVGELRFRPPEGCLSEGSTPGPECEGRRAAPAVVPSTITERPLLLNGKALGGPFMTNLWRALKVGVGMFGVLMILGVIGAYLDDEGAPSWVVVPLWWAAGMAGAPGFVICRWFLRLPSVGPPWLNVLEEAIFFCSGVVAWSTLAWAGLWCWRRRHSGTKPEQASSLNVGRGLEK